jgi:hypothetical protein
MHDLHVTELRRIGQGHCPDCGHRGFVIGPMAGPTPLHVNIECGGCRHRFNAVFYASSIVTAHRLPSVEQGGNPWASDPSEGAPS